MFAPYVCLFLDLSPETDGFVAISQLSTSRAVKWMWFDSSSTLGDVDGNS
jgi:hypothetical protein